MIFSSWWEEEQQEEISVVVLQVDWVAFWKEGEEGSMIEHHESLLEGKFESWREIWLCKKRNIGRKESPHLVIKEG